MARDDQTLVDYYQRELAYLRRAGVDFARSYPKIARRLELGPDQSADPNVERLIESFAFLTGRLQRDLEAEFPRFTNALLGLLHPQLTAPTPAMAIAKFDVDSAQGKLTTGFRIERGTPVHAMTDDALRCRFRTTAPTTLWPVKVVEAAIVSLDAYDWLDSARAAAALRLTLTAEGESFSTLALDRLRFYINADAALANELMDLVCARCRDVAFAGPGLRPSVLRADRHIQQAGFHDDEAALPYPPQAHPAYRLLHEYFAFPEKFRFFDVVFPRLTGAGDRLELLFLLDAPPTRRLSLEPEQFALGCAPVINLFTKQAEPIRLDVRRSEQRVIPDLRLERTTEIHSVLSVVGYDENSDRADYAPYFSYDHTRADDGAGGAWWLARREAASVKDMGGSDVYLSFVDLGLNPEQPPAQTIVVEALCTNRLLPEQLSAFTKLHREWAGPIRSAALITRPTAPRPPAAGGETAWKLVSHLSLNYLSLSGGADSLRALKEILRLYSPGDDPALEEQIQGLRDLTSRRAVRRVGDDGWRGFRRGIELTLDIDERRFVGGSAYLFASVLDRFFGLYASVNAFTQLTVTSAQRGGVWKQWPPRIGALDVL